MGDRSRDYDRGRERERDRGRDRDDRRPNDMPHFTGREDSRVGDHEFTFEHPRHPQMDSYRPGQDNRDDHQRSRAPPTGPRGSRGRGGARGGRGGYDRGGRGSRDGKPFVFTPSVPAHERPILYFDTREKTPELMAGMVSGSGDRFKEDVEEQDEKADGGNKDTAMEISGDEEQLGEKAPTEAEGQPKPEKKPDVISMIRAFKSKTAITQRNAVAENDDFIPLSFDDDDDKAEPKSEPESEPEPEPEEGRKMRKVSDGHRIVEHHGHDRTGSDPNTSPTGRFSHRDHHHQQAQERRPVLDVGPPGVASVAPSAASLPPPPPLGSTIKFNLGDTAKAIATRELPKPVQPSFAGGKDMPWPPPPPPTDLPAPPPPPPPPVGRPLAHLDLPKKRKFEDFIGRKLSGAQLDGNIKHQYQVVRGSGVSPAPWVKLGSDHSRCFDMADWLHKEITDFVSYIQPHAYEHAVRRELVHRIRCAITNIWPDTDVRVFGSFAAELYLPTSDIDLVVVSEDFAHYDIPKYCSRHHLHQLAGELVAAGIALQRPQVIAKAKVPIIKFVDSVTRISVDISFENASGMIANDTFQKWKKTYPAMPILVLLVKHFLSMRGLNEPYVGGLGSFSVTCLVISMLQLLPSVRSGRIEPRLHFGVMLLEFLELYGKNFNTDNVGIRVDEEAPGYFSKKGVFDATVSKPFQLAIQDPNDPKNDVSKSSYAIRLILSTFSDAYDALIKQMTILDKLPFSERVGRSILGVIIGGDYNEVERQRARMRQVYISKIGKIEDVDMMLKQMTDQEETEKVKKSKRNTKGRRKRPAESEEEEEKASLPNGKGGNEPEGKLAKLPRTDAGGINTRQTRFLARKEKFIKQKEKREKLVAETLQSEAVENKVTKAAESAYERKASAPEIIVID